MKRILYCLWLTLAYAAAMSQNVGVGESNPGAKLTIRSSDPSSRSLLVKTTANDTAFFILGSSHYMGGYTPTSSSLTLNNKYFLPFDNVQLTILASGERSGINAAGSFSTIDFRNINSNARYNFSSYLGGAAPHNMGLYYNNPDDGTSRSLLYFTQDGNAGFGTFSPQNRLQVHNTNGSNTSYAQFTNTSTGANATDGLLVGMNGVGHAFVYNQETSRLYFGTSGLTRMTITESGNVGIGIDPPTEKLDVFGNINASGIVRVGEVHRTSTGSANLIPIAYGNIAPGGVVSSGSGNFTVSKLTTGWYAITIAGESYQFTTYSTSVTPSGGGTPIMATTGSGSGNLHVYTFNASGVATDSQFAFVVYKQ